MARTGKVEFRNVFADERVVSGFMSAHGKITAVTNYGRLMQWLDEEQQWSLSPYPVIAPHNAVPSSGG